jgi:hypothetical protein
MHDRNASRLRRSVSPAFLATLPRVTCTIWPGWGKKGGMYPLTQIAHATPLEQGYG